MLLFYAFQPDQAQQQGLAAMNKAKQAGMGAVNQARQQGMGAVNQMQNLGNQLRQQGMQQVGICCCCCLFMGRLNKAFVLGVILFPVFDIYLGQISNPHGCASRMVKLTR